MVASLLSCPFATPLDTGGGLGVLYTIVLSSLNVMGSVAVSLIFRYQFMCFVVCYSIGGSRRPISKNNT